MMPVVIIIKSKRCKSLDASPEIVSMRRYLKKHNFVPVRDLRLREFPNTGRGVCSKNKVEENGTLMEMPFDLMITFCTVIQSDIYKGLQYKDTLNIYDYLSIFLATEKQKSEKSDWAWYIETLPKEPPLVPWLCEETKINVLPDDVRIPIYHQHIRYRDSWERVKRSLGTNLFPEEVFRWAYVMVNTRSIYIQPGTIRSLAKKFKINYEIQAHPDTALCPYLDMFNHSNSVMTSVYCEPIGSNYFFKIITHDSFKAHEQIFITYGPKDNLKLFIYYGFFTNNIYSEGLSLTFEDIVKCGKFNITSEQKSFISKHNLSSGLDFSDEDLSFSLKGLLFVLSNKNFNASWNSVILKENYSSSDLLKMYSFIFDFLIYKINLMKNDVHRIEDMSIGNCEYFKHVLNFLRSRINHLEIFRQKLITKFDFNKN